MKYFSVLIVLLLGVGTSVLAQKTIENQQLFWGRYFMKFKLNDQLIIGQEFENRAYWFPWRQHQFFSRTTAMADIGNNWKAGGGFTYFIQSLPHDPNVTNAVHFVELRPQLQLSNKQTLSEKLALHHRYWGEFRIYELADGSFEYNSVRFRYQFDIRYSPLPTLTFQAFNEIHLNIGSKIVQNVFDQNRYGASVTYRVAKPLTLNVAYLNWFQQLVSGTDFFNRHIVRVTVISTFDLRKK